MNTDNLVSYLPFDSSTTEDLCGGTWTATGSPTIQDYKLYVDGSSWLKRTETFELTGQPFTIGVKFSTTRNTTGGSPCLWQMYKDSSTRFQFSISTSGILTLWKDKDSTLNLTTASSVLDGQEHYAECDFDGTTWYFFLDGVLIGSKTHSPSNVTYTLYVGTNYATGRKFTGTIDEFMIYDGVALHTEDFTPPTDEEYAALKLAMGSGAGFSFDADTERVIANTAWKPSMALKVWLPFDRTPTEDLCGNEWIVDGNPTIDEAGAINGNALQVDNYGAPMGWSCLSMTDGITLGGRNFTIKICASLSRYPDKWNGGWGELFVLATSPANILNDLFYASDSIFLAVCTNKYLYSGCLGTRHQIVELELNRTYFFEYVYSHNDSKVYIFLDGQKVNTVDVSIPETFFQYVLIDYSHWTRNHPTAAIDEFKIYDRAALHTEDFTPPTAENYIAQMLEEEGQASFGYIVNTERVLTNTREPLDPYIAFTGASGCYAEIPLETLAGKRDFTIEAKISTTSTANYSNNYQWKTIVGREIQGGWKDDFGLCVNNGKLCFWAEPASDGSSLTCNTETEAVINDGMIHKVAVVSFEGAIDLYCDEELVAHTDNVNAKITDSYTLGIANNINNSSSPLAMNFYEARLWSVARLQEEIFADIQGDENGLEAWYIPACRTDIIPDVSGHERHATLYGSPTLSYIYETNCDLQADMEVIIFNSATGFIYTEDEAGANLNFLDSLDLAMSRTGTAFYQTALEKCFNIPPIPEVWMEFDVYFDGTHRWRAFNGGENGYTGIMCNTGEVLNFYSNGSSVSNFTGVCKANELQTFRLHMVTGATDGIIEAWVDGQFINKYTGDVNHGDYFADLFLQSDGEGTFFSNFRISNTGFPDHQYLLLDFNMERRVQNTNYGWQSKANADGMDKLAEELDPDQEKSESDDKKIFSNYSIVRCFDLPPTFEIWMDFDVYFDGVSNWRAGNAGERGVCGLMSSVDGTLNYLSNGATVQSFANLCLIGRVQPILLHMISGVEDGVIETWANGEYAGRYIGDVNYGEDFADIFLQNDDSGTVFSNMLFSTNRLDPRHYDWYPPITLCVRHNGEIAPFKLRYFNTPKTPAFAVHYDGKNWYNFLVDPTSERAGIVRVFHDGREYALTAAT